MSHQPQPPHPPSTPAAATAAAIANPNNTYRPVPPPQYPTPTQYAYPYAQYSPYQHPGGYAAAYQYYSHHPTTTPPIPPPTYKPALPTLSLSNTAHAQHQAQSQPQVQSQPQSQSQSQSQPQAQSTQPAQTTQATKTAAKKTQSLKGTFSRDLRTLMYAFGDAKEPASDSVDVMEEILIEYLTDVCHTALAPTRKTRIQIEDLRRALSRFPDGKKLARLEELLFMQDDIRRARKQFSTEEDQLQAQVD